MRSRAAQSQGQSVDWRRRRLRSAGFDESLAEQLANDRRVDLHSVLELIDRGCRPDLAARIVAPLGDEPEEQR